MEQSKKWKKNWEPGYFVLWICQLPSTTLDYKNPSQLRRSTLGLIRFLKSGYKHFSHYRVGRLLAFCMECPQSYEHQDFCWRVSIRLRVEFFVTDLLMTVYKFMVKLRMAYEYWKSLLGKILFKFLQIIFLFSAENSSLINRLFLSETHSIFKKNLVASIPSLACIIYIFWELSVLSIFLLYM